MSQKYTAPTVNKNGTSREELVALELEVRRVVKLLQVALHNAFPNGRDYQLSPQGTLERAEAEARLELAYVTVILERHTALLDALHQR